VLAQARSTSASGMATAFIVRVPATSSAMTDEGRTVGARLEALYDAAVLDLLAHADDADRAALARVTASLPRLR
jgi:hypothetical protein